MPLVHGRPLAIAEALLQSQVLARTRPLGRIQAWAAGCCGSESRAAGLGPLVPLVMLCGTAWAECARRRKDGVLFRRQSCLSQFPNTVFGSDEHAGGPAGY